MQQTPHNAHSSIRTSRLTLAWLLFALALVYFIVRGPMRIADGYWDFQCIYGAVASWVDGQNPYDFEHMNHALMRRGAQPFEPHQKDGFPSVYPPPTFAALSIYGSLPWTLARTSWIFTNMAALLAAFAAMRIILNWRWMDAKFILVCAAVLALAPLHTGFAFGQVTLVTTALLLWMVIFADRRQAYATGVTFAFACAFKPQLAGLFLFYLIYRRQWFAIFIAAAIGSTMFAVALARLQTSGHNWLQTYQQNLHTFTHGGVSDPTAANPLRFQLLNLHYPLSAWFASRSTVAAIIWLCAPAAGIATALNLRRHATHNAAAPNLHAANNTTSLMQRNGLFLSILTILTLLMVPHRAYDALLLVFPLCWVAATLGKSVCAPAQQTCPCTRRLAWLAAVLLTLFLVPGPVILILLERRGHIPQPLLHEPLWHGLIVPHQTWALAALLMGLLILQSRERGESHRATKPPGHRGQERDKLPLLMVL